MFTNVGNISQYMHVSSHPVVHLQLRSVTCQLRLSKAGEERNMILQD